MNYLIDFLSEFWTTLCVMSPALLFGFLVAGILSELLSPKYIETHLGKPGIFSTIKATLFGVPLPLCSCGVIPVTASLRKHGATKGAAVAFLTSTPQTGVDSIFVTWSMLGPIFGVVRPLVAFISGIFGGIVIDAVTEEDKKAPSATTDEYTTSQPKFVKMLKYGFGVLVADIARALLIGLVLAAIISHPALDIQSFFYSLADKGTIGNLSMMLLMLAFGIPLYVCSTASVPIAYALMLKGVSPGAALVFLMAGPATNAAALSAVYKILGRKVSALYLGCVMLSTLASGILLDFVYSSFTEGKVTVEHCDEITWWEHGAAVVMIALIVYQIGKSFLGPKAGSCCSTEESESSCCSTTANESSCCSSGKEPLEVDSSCCSTIVNESSCCSSGEESQKIESSCCSTASTEASCCSSVDDSSEECSSDDDDNDSSSCCCSH